VEDRVTPGLYLERSDETHEAYASRRVPDVLARAGVARATWWENVCLGRRGIRCEWEDFPTLGLYEVDESFVPPAPGGGVSFVRTSRPGQGVLTGRPTVGLSLVLISPTTEEEAQSLRDWADFVHIRHIAETANPGYAMITPYENRSGGDPRWMHLYEMDTGDPEAAFLAMTPRVAERLGGSFGTPAFDAWAFHPALRIVYVNTFRLAGSAIPAAR
jgi:hypothetical protein